MGYNFVADNRGLSSLV